MTRLLRLAARLYPPAWRARYGIEFETLLEDAGSGWRDLADVLKGAFLMQFTGRNFAAMAMAICGAVGLIAAAIFAFQTQDTYVSTAVVRLGPGLGADPLAGLARIEQQVLSRSSLNRIIQTVGLYPEERAKIPLEDIVEQMRNRRIQIQPVRKPGNPGAVPYAIEIRFSDPDRAKAQAVTRELTRRFIEGGPPSVAMMNAPAVVAVELLDPASLPQRPSEPNRPVWIVAGLLIGLAAGLALASARRWPVVALSAIAGALVAGALSFAIPSRWVATAVVAVQPPEAASLVMAYVRQNASGMAVREMPARPGTLVIEAGGRNPQLAVTTVRQFLAELVPHSGNRIVEMQVLDPASTGNRPASPNRVSIVLTGLAAGLLLGLFLERFRPRRAVALPAN